MTVDQGLRKVHREYEGDTDYLEFSDNETKLRIEYLKDAIKDWIDKFPQYREAITSLLVASDGTKLTTLNTTEYNAPTNFIRNAGEVKIGDSIYLEYIDPAEMAAKIKEDPNGQWYTILGYPGAFKIKINPSQAANLAINYDYYGEVTMPTTTTSSIPIARPLYAVYYTLWKLYKEDDPEQEKKYKELMDEEVRLELVALSKTPGGPNRIKFAGAGFGDTSSSVSDIRTGQ